MEYTFSRALTGMKGSAIREIFKVASRPEVISFAGGLPASDALPVAQVGEIAAEVFADREEGLRCLQYSLTEGIPGFREVVLALAAEAGITGRTPEETLILSGGSQGLDLMCKAFLNPGDVVLVENPTFLGFLQTVQAYNGVAVGVEGEADGIDLTDLEAKMRAHRPKLLYVIPTFSNPTGKTYPAAKRRAVVELAARYGVIVIEDDPYGRLRFSGEAVPALASFDDKGVVVHVASFSKTVSPGLRVGYAIGPAEIIRKMAIGKQGADLHTACLSQLIVKRYIEKGHFHPNIARSLPLYRERKEAMTAALRRYMPPAFRCTDPEGGLFIWGEFTDGTDTFARFHDAVARNVAFIQGAVFYPDGSGKNTLRLNYSNESPERIETGIKALGSVFGG